MSDRDRQRAEQIYNDAFRRSREGSKGRNDVSQQNNVVDNSSVRQSIKDRYKREDTHGRRK